MPIPFRAARAALPLFLSVAIACAFALAPVGRAQTIDPIVLYAGDVDVQAGAIARATSSTGAGGYKMTSADAGWESLSSPSSQPVHYFEIPFDAVAGVPYHLWLRMRAAADSKWNDSVWVQFDHSVNADGSAVWRTGTASALLVNLEDCSGCGVAGWGWQDNAWWLTQPATVRFASTGRHRIRVQLREDGVDVDQVVLSTSVFASVPPGALRNDTTVVPRSGAAVPALTRQPYLQQVTPTSAVVVFATARAGVASVRLADPAGAVRSVPAQSVSVGSDLSGGATYYQHVARVTGLSAGTTYGYDPLLDGVDLTAGSDLLTTGPATGTGQVRFVAFGDSGVGSTAQRQLASRLAGDAFDFALHTGDVAYGDPGGVGAGAMPYLQRWFFDIYRDWLRRRPIFPSIGNHDEEAQSARPYLSAFVLPESGATPAYPDHAERYYSFDYGPVHVVVLDTELAFQDVMRRQAQEVWLSNDLAASRQPWKIAVFHRSPYSAGGEHGSDVAVRAAFEPLLAAGGVSLVLSGHEHDYERTLPQQASRGLGITYVVTGGGGAPLYPAATASWTAASASRYHYVRAVADACRLVLDAVGDDGSVFDRATIDRCSSGIRPYQSQAAVVPGRIEAERFDEGGEGVAYHDSTAPNEGGQFRATGVDVEASADLDGGYNVGWIFPGEWLTYTVNVTTTGEYEIAARVASPGMGGTFTVSLDGVPVPGAFQIPATGGWQRWQTIRGSRVSLTSGTHRVRIDMRTVSAPGAAVGNFNYIAFTPAP